MLQIFGYISAFLSVIMVAPYIRDIFLKETKPERASWFIWTVLTSIAFFSQLAKGATDSLWLSGGQTLAVLIVFILSTKYGVGGLTKRDIKALIAAGIGLVIWYLTDEPAYALFIAIIIDAIGTFLTVIKAYQEPETETTSTFVMSGTSGIFGLLAVGSLNPILLAFPIYIIVANYSIVAAILLGKRKGLQATS
ncbi:MAG: hypothetical protein AAB726_02530 [Patescibacteria group bacterium]